MQISTILRCCLLSVCSFLLTMTATAGEAVFGYGIGAEYTYEWGSGKLEEYCDVAIFVPGVYTGKTITKVRMPFATQSCEIENVKLWLSENLTLEKNAEGKKVAAPDVISLDVTIGADGYAEAVFGEPYTITDKGVYVGCSFFVDTLKENAKTAKPIILNEIGEKDGFWVHSTKTYYSWKDCGLTLGAMPMEVYLSGIDDYAVVAEMASDVFVAYDKDFTLDLDLVNLGATRVSNVDISYEVGLLSGNIHVDLPTALPNILGSEIPVNISLPTIGERGSKELSIVVEKVNGVVNVFADSATTTLLTAISFIPKHRPIFEEYTGLWCGYCPRGFIGMERMNSLYPEDFIAISYHYDDDMEITTNYPTVVRGFPTAWIDRFIETDPYYGFSREGFGIDVLWETISNMVTPVGVETKAVLSEDENFVDGTITLTAAMDKNLSGYHIELVLTADDLYNETWKQSNGYSGNYPPDDNPDWLVFTAGGNSVAGLHFNDVIVATSRLDDTNVALDGVLADEASASYQYRFDLNNVPVFQSKAKLNFIAILVAPDGSVVNACKSHVTTSMGVGRLDTDKLAKVVAYYDLMGRRVHNPDHGIYIVRTSDNKCHKVVL